MEYLNSISNYLLNNIEVTIALLVIVIVVFKALILKENIKKEEILNNIERIRNINLFTSLSNSVMELEHDVYKTKNKIAFVFGKATEAIECLSFLDSKNAKILAIKNITRLENKNTTILDSVSIFLEDENGVIYLLLVYRSDEIKAGEISLTQYGMTIPFVLTNNHLKKMTNIYNVNDLFLPRDAYGEPQKESTENINILEDIDNDKITLTFFWNNKKNARFHFRLESLSGEE